jgi:hypothetical protein
MLKRPEGEVKPTNIEVPLTAILPDVFSQVELSLDASFRKPRNESERRAVILGNLRAGMISEFSMALLRLEERLPASLLSSRQ